MRNLIMVFILGFMLMAGISWAFHENEPFMDQSPMNRNYNWMEQERQKQELRDLQWRDNLRFGRPC